MRKIAINLETQKRNASRSLPVRPISTQEKFPPTENFPKIFSDGKFVLATQILQNFLYAENFPRKKIFLSGNGP
jgi:hypothetical protein